MSDQSNAETSIVRPCCWKPLESIRVNGQGPAMHEARTLRNSLPIPASRVIEALVAFQLPSGEQGAWRLHGMFPRLTTWKVLTALPMSSSV